MMTLAGWRSREMLSRYAKSAERQRAIAAARRVNVGDRLQFGGPRWTLAGCTGGAATDYAVANLFPHTRQWTDSDQSSATLMGSHG